MSRRPTRRVGCPTAVGWLLLMVLAAAGCGPAESASDPSARATPDDSAPSAAGYLFTYSEILTRAASSLALGAIRDQVLPPFAEQGAQLIGVWNEVPLADDAPFERLGPEELLVMIAWPDSMAGNPSFEVDRTLRTLDEVVGVRTRVFRATVRPERVRQLTRPGFYVHRLDRFEPDDVNTVIRLSVEAWQTFEPTFGAEVVGLLRETPDRDGQAQMLRIAWYRSYEGWQESRMFGRDPSSLERFRARGELQIDSEGLAGGLAVN